jgi:hypothetical protein
MLVLYTDAQVLSIVFCKKEGTNFQILSKSARSQVCFSGFHFAKKKKKARCGKQFCLFSQLIGKRGENARSLLF